MRHALDTIAEIAGFDGALQVPWHELRFQHTTLIRTQLRDRYAASTTNKMLSALRQTLKMAWRLGQMSAEEYQAAADVENVRGDNTVRAAAGREVTAPERMALFEACDADESPAGDRDAAIIAVLYACGLRRAEVAGLDAGDVDLEGSRLTIRGKGNKVRSVPVGAAWQRLRAWTDIQDSDDGPLFVRVWRGGALSVQRLTPQGIYHILRKRADQAGVKPFTPHDLRRTYAGDLLDAGADISTVQQMMGHANTSTTAGYDRRGERVKQEAADMLNVP